jgi:hypothetical protein
LAGVLKQQAENAKRLILQLDTYSLAQQPPAFRIRREKAKSIKTPG